VAENFIAKKKGKKKQHADVVYAFQERHTQRGLTV
jgi:hypothetical protein